MDLVEIGRIYGYLKPWLSRHFVLLLGDLFSCASVGIGTAVKRLDLPSDWASPCWGAVLLRLIGVFFFRCSLVMLSPFYLVHVLCGSWPVGGVCRGLGLVAGLRLLMGFSLDRWRFWEEEFRILKFGRWMFFLFDGRVGMGVFFGYSNNWFCWLEGWDLKKRLNFFLEGWRLSSFGILTIEFVDVWKKKVWNFWWKCKDGVFLVGRWMLFSMEG